MTARAIPAESSAAYLAASMIHRAGSVPRADLLDRITFSERPCNAGQALSAVIRSGWLNETQEGVTLSELSQRHFGSAMRKSEKYQGIAATSRTPLTSPYDRPPLSAKYRVSSKGFRDDVPEYSVRDKASPRIAPMGSKQP